jgi:hypothetical protein
VHGFHGEVSLASKRPIRDWTTASGWGSPLLFFFFSTAAAYSPWLEAVGSRVQIDMELQMLHPFSGMELLTHLVHVNLHLITLLSMKNQ